MSDVLPFKMKVVVLSLYLVHLCTYRCRGKYIFTDTEVVMKTPLLIAHCEIKEFMQCVLILNVISLFIYICIVFFNVISIGYNTLVPTSSTNCLQNIYGWFSILGKSKKREGHRGPYLVNTVVAVLFLLKQ